MKISKGPLVFWGLTAFLFIGLIISWFANYYSYSTPFSGKVEKIRFDVKTNMTITVSGKEYQIAHHWPLLQKYVKVGDSVIKALMEW